MESPEEIELRLMAAEGSLSVALTVIGALIALEPLRDTLVSSLDKFEDIAKHLETDAPASQANKAGIRKAVASLREGLRLAQHAALVRAGKTPPTKQ